MMLKHLLAVLVSFFWIMGPPSHAQSDWPRKPVVIVVPYPAGGNTDTMARLLAEQLRQRFGQPFIVENRPAGGGTVAATQIAQVEDGHTLFFATAVQMVILPLMQKVNYASDDFKPISALGAGPFVLTVHSTVPANNLQEFINFAKTQKDKINFSHAGQGGFSHLAAALLAKRAGLDVVFVPHRGGAPAMQALVSGDVHAYFGNASEIIQQLEGGKIRPLAISVRKRMPQLSQAVPLAETFAGFEMSSWNGLLASAKTSDETVNKLASAIADFTRMPAFADQLQKLGIEPIGNSPSEFAETIRSEVSIYKEALEAAGSLLHQ